MYDWAALVWLSWFSNLTHQNGLIFLRTELRQKHYFRLFRVVMMTALTFMLFVSIVPITSFVWMSPTAADGFSGTIISPSLPAFWFSNGTTVASLWRVSAAEHSLASAW